jgi:hypothetical protein
MKRRLTIIGNPQKRPCADCKIVPQVFFGCGIFEESLCGTCYDIAVADEERVDKSLTARNAKITADAKRNGYTLEWSEDRLSYTCIAGPPGWAELQAKNIWYKK